jgi:hypothetical protein
MTEYSGRVTADNCIGTQLAPRPALQTELVFQVQWTDCPVEVEEEVKRLWENEELGNDRFYFQWSRESEAVNEDGDEKPLHEVYPIIDEFLVSKGVTTCLIHWWW